MLKRTLAMLLALVMVLGMCPVNAFATDTGVVSDSTDVPTTDPIVPDDEGVGDWSDWEHIPNGDTGTTMISRYYGGEYDYLEIPETLDGFTVTGIAPRTFAKEVIGTLILPGTVTSIGEDAFYLGSITYVEFDGTAAQWAALRENTATGNDAFLAASYECLRKDALALDKTVTMTIRPESYADYWFIPEESGIYQVMTTGTEDGRGGYYHCYVNLSSHTDGTGKDLYGYFYAEAGQTYAVYVNNDSGVTLTTELTFTKVPVLRPGDLTTVDVGGNDGVYYALEIADAGKYTLRTSYVELSPEYEGTYGNIYYITAWQGGLEYAMTKQVDGSYYCGFEARENTVALCRVHNQVYDTARMEVEALAAPEEVGVTFRQSHLEGDLGYTYDIYVDIDPVHGWTEMVFATDNDSIANVTGQFDGGCWIELVGGGETTLTVTTASGFSDTMTIFVDAPEELALGVPSQETMLPSGEAELYRFTASEDGIYYFRYPMTYVEDYGWVYPDLSYSLRQGKPVEMVRDLWAHEEGYRYTFYRITADTVLELRLNNYNGWTEALGCLLVNKAEVPQQVTANMERVKGMVDSEHWLYVDYQPVTAYGELSWSIGNGDIADVEVSGNEFHILLKQVGETELTVSCGDATLQIPVICWEPQDMESGVTYEKTLELDETFYYHFTPAESGVYCFAVPYEDVDGNRYLPVMGLENGDGRFVTTEIVDGRYVYYYELNADEEYTFRLYNNSGKVLNTSATVFPEPKVEAITWNYESICGKLGETFYLEILGWEPGEARLEQVSFEIEDPEVAQILSSGWHDVNIMLMDGGKTNLIASGDGFTIKLPIEVAALPQIGLDETVSATFQSGEGETWSFTPAVSGFYTFSTPMIQMEDRFYSCDLSIGSSADEGWYRVESDWGVIRWDTFWIEAGTRMRVSLRNYHDVTLTPSLTVTATPAAEEVYASPVTILLGESTSYTPTCSPYGAWSKLSFAVKDDSIVRITDSNYASVSLQSVAVGSTTMTVTAENGFSATCTVSVVSPVEIGLDETVNAEISGEVDAFFAFTAPETGMYTFKTPVIKTEADDCYAFINWHTYREEEPVDMGEQRTGSYYYRYYRLTEGATVIVNVSNPFADRSISSALTVEKTVEATGIAFTEKAVEGRYESYANVRLQFLPEGAYGDGYIQYEMDDDSVAWVNWRDGMQYQVYLAAEGNTTLTAIVGQWRAELPITVLGNPELTLGETYEVSLESGYEAFLDFTAPADGVYRFFVPYHYVPELNGTACADMRDIGIEEGGYFRQVREVGTQAGFYRFYYMSKDTTIHMVLCNYYGVEMASTILVENAPTPDRIYFETDAAAGVAGSTLYFSVGYEPYETYADLTFTLSDGELAMIEELGSNYCRVRLLKSGAVTLTVSCGELSISRTITVSEPLELKADEPLTLEMEYYGSTEITFTFPETGMYMLKASYPYNHLNWSNIRLLSGSGFVHGGSVDAEGYRILYLQADAGSVLALSAQAYFQGECTFTATRTTEPTAMGFTADTLRLTPGEWGSAYLSFSPDNGYAKVSWSVKDEDIVRISYDGGSYVNLEMLSAGTTTLTATYGELTAEMTIIVYEPTALKLDEQTPVSVDAGNNVRMQFTAPEEGIYAFYTPYQQTEYGGRVNLYVYTDGSGDWSDLGGYSRTAGYVRFVWMAAGANVSLRVQNEYGMDMDTYVLAEKANTPTELKPDTTEIRGVPNSYGYVNIEFAPDTAYGELTFAVKDRDVADIYEINSAGCSLKLLTLGETTLTVSCGEVSVTIDVIVEPPAELKLDEKLQIPGLSGPKYVSFEAPETGLYAFETPHVVGYEEGMGGFGTYIFTEPNSELPKGSEYRGRYYYDDCAVAYFYLEKGVVADLVVINYNAVKLDAYVKPFKAATLTSIAFEEAVLMVDRDDCYHTVRLNVEPFGSYEDIRWSCSGEDLEFYGYGNETEFYADQLGSWVITATTESGKTASFTVNVVEKFDPPDYEDPEVSVAEVVTADGVTPYDTLAEAIANAKGGYVRLSGNFDESITVTMDTYLDVNGYVITGDVIIEEGATLYAFDTATADYDAEDMGGIMGQITGNLARSLNTPKALYGHNYKYMAVEWMPGVWTFHRYYLTVKSVILAPCVEEEGIVSTEVNYRTVLKTNEAVLEYITAHGAKFVGEETVYANYFTGGIELVGGENVHTVGLGGTMKTANTASENLKNSLLAPTVSAYIQLSDGTILESAPVSRSLQQMAVYANDLTDLRKIQKEALGRMYDLFKPAMDGFSVDISNIKAYAAEYWGTDTAVTFAIMTQPESVTAPVGSNAVFSVVATGEGLTYQWQYLVSGGSWTNTANPGYNTAELTVEARDYRNGYQYRCVITDAEGNTLITDAVTLTVKEKFAIVTQPESVTAPVGSNAVFSVVATGEGLTYQWQYIATGGSWTNTANPGYDTAELTVEARDYRNGYQYRCIITDAEGNTLTTEAATLTVQ